MSARSGSCRRQFRSSGLAATKKQRSSDDRDRSRAFSFSHWCSLASSFGGFRWRRSGTTAQAGRDAVLPSIDAHARTATSVSSPCSCKCAKRILLLWTPPARASPRSSCASCPSSADTTFRGVCFVLARPKHAPPRSATACACASSRMRSIDTRHRTWPLLAACPQASGVSLFSSSTAQLYRYYAGSAANNQPSSPCATFRERGMTRKQSTARKPQRRRRQCRPSPQAQRLIVRSTKTRRQIPPQQGARALREPRAFMYRATMVTGSRVFAKREAPRILRGAASNHGLCAGLRAAKHARENAVSELVFHSHRDAHEMSTCPAVGVGSQAAR